MPALFADICVIQKGVPSMARPGEALAYTITVTNKGPDAAEGVVLTDHIPLGLSDVEFSVDGGLFKPWLGRYVIGTMPGGASREVIISGTVDIDITGRITNVAQVACDTPNLNYSNNASTATTMILSPREQAISDMVQSVALQEAVLAHMLNEEPVAEKDITTGQLVVLNHTVERLVEVVARLEAALDAKYGNAPFWTK